MIITTARDLIRLSTREHRTVTEYPEDAEAARALLTDLGAEADDDCDVWTHHSGAGWSGPESAGYYDIWGTANGCEWRVHVVADELDEGQS